jgi:hypothetical protein
MDIAGHQLLQDLTRPTGTDIGAQATAYAASAELTLHIVSLTTEQPPRPTHGPRTSRRRSVRLHHFRRRYKGVPRCDAGFCDPSVAFIAARSKFGGTASSIKLLMIEASILLEARPSHDIHGH